MAAPLAAKPKVLVQAFIDPSIARLVSAEAKRQRRSRAAMLRVILDQWADQRRQEEQSA